MNGCRLLWLRWCMGAVLLGNVTARAQKPPTQPAAFRPGHFRLVNGVRHEGQLCLVSDNELLVKVSDTARVRQYAAVHLQNFVIATDSFTVLRGFDVSVNNVVTRYPSALVQVLLPGPALPVYRLSGPMDVFPEQVNPAVRHVLRGISGGAAGIAAGLITDNIANNSAKRFKHQPMTLLVLRAAPNKPFETLQPQTIAARTRLQALASGNAELTARLRKTPYYLLKEELMLVLLTQYFAGLPPAGH